MSTLTFAPTIFAPAVRPTRRPFNLLTVAVLLGDGEGNGGNPERILNGLDLQPFPRDEGGAVEACISGSTILKAEGDPIEIPKFGGVTAYIPISCSTFGNLNWGEFTDRANAALDARLPVFAERQLVAGQYKDDQPYLGDINATDWAGGAVSNTGVTPAEALSRLEQAVGDVEGVIHAPPSIVSAWSQLGYTLEDSGGVLYTLLGTPVVSGAGYARKNPVNGNAPAADQEWAWASGPVQYRLGAATRMNPPVIGEALDRVSNDLTYRAERDLIVAWDPTGPQVTVLVDRSP